MIKHLFVLGSGEVPFQILKWGKAQKINTTSITDGGGAKKQVLSAGKTYKESLSEEKIPCLITDNPDNLDLRSLKLTKQETLFISIGAPWIISEKAITNVFLDRIVNLHGTYLPRYRGGVLFSWNILTGQRTGICLLHKLTEKVDQGPILGMEEFIFPSSCRKPCDYMSYYEGKSFEFLKEFIQHYNNSDVNLIAQPEYFSSYWPRLKAEVHGWLDWTWDFHEIERLICAFDAPYGGARCKWRNKTVIVREAWAQSTDGYTHPFQHGLVYRNNGKWLNVAAKGGELLICSIRDEKGNDLLSSIKVGDRLYTLPENISQTTQRVIKSTSGLVVQKHK